MMNSFENTSARGGNEMMGEEGMGEETSRMCVHIYLKDDGTAVVSTEEGAPIPEDGTPARSLDEALEMARGMATENPEQDATDMAAAKSGYSKRAMRRMDAPNPGAVFGE